MQNIGDFLKAQAKRNVAKNMWKYQTEEVKFSEEVTRRINYYDRKFNKLYITLWLLLLPFLGCIKGLF